MLQFATDQPGLALALLVHHDDDTSEVAHAVGAGAALERVQGLRWMTISLANDCKKVFAHEAWQTGLSAWKHAPGARS